MYTHLHAHKVQNVFGFVVPLTNLDFEIWFDETLYEWTENEFAYNSNQWFLLKSKWFIVKHFVAYGNGVYEQIWNYSLIFTHLDHFGHLLETSEIPKGLGILGRFRHPTYIYYFLKIIP